MKISYVIVKINNRYIVDLGTHEMVYDQNGHYLGQYQPNMELGAGYIWIAAIEGGVMFRGVVVPIADLTHSEMDNLEITIDTCQLS